MAGSFSSANVFYSLFLKIFLLVYSNGKANSTFYIRYLNLETFVYPAKLWFKGGKYGKGPQVEDVEAVFRYAWYKSPPGPKGFNYTRLTNPEFFNNQYHQVGVLKPRHRFGHGKWLVRRGSDRTGAGRW